MNGFFDRHRKFAVLGLSRDPKAFSRQIYAFLSAQGYEMLIVNPNADFIDDQTCYQTVESLPEVDAAIFFTKPRITEAVLPSCKEKGIVDAWFQQGSADDTVMKMAGELGIDYKSSCVFLQFSNTGFPHNLHRFVMKILGME